MLRVYLDQNKWIELSRIRNGRARAGDSVAANDLITYACEHRLASFPLSGAHYMETWKRGDPASRQRLGRTMYELSQLDTMAGPSTLTPHEIELALHLALEVPAARPRCNVFGRGVGHAFGMPAVDFEVPAAANLSPEMRFQLRSDAIEAQERLCIETPSFELPAMGIARPNDEHGERYAEGERNSARLLQEHGFSRDAVRRFVFASEYLDIWAPLEETVERHRIDFTAVVSSEETLTAFLELMPTRWMTAHLRRECHNNPSNKWHSHDLNDIAYLAVAAVHCDVVVAERKVANYLKRLPIDVPAMVITKLDDLPALLVGA